MQIFSQNIPDVKVITPKKNEDYRGFFSESYNKKALEVVGIHSTFVQDNHSLSVEKGTLRGLHFQMPPFAQEKLVRVTQGSILDVAVDIRKNSPTFGKHVSVVISAKEWNQILIPIGFAHGFCTLEANTEVIYKVTNYYSAEHDRGIIWNDSDLSIEWPVTEQKVILSAKDKLLPQLKHVKELF